MAHSYVEHIARQCLERTATAAHAFKEALR